MMMMDDDDDDDDDDDYKVFMWNVPKISSLL